jgi:hypothetical protein
MKERDLLGWELLNRKPQTKLDQTELNIIGLFGFRLQIRFLFL